MTDWLVSELQVEPGDMEVGRSFFDYGMDSVMVVKLTQDLGRWLGCSIDATAAWSFPTVESLSRHLAAQTAAARPPLFGVPSEHQPQSHDRYERAAATERLKAFSDIEMAELLQAEISAARQRKGK